MRRECLAPDFSAVRGRRVLIALSGGADSVALAALLAEAREALGLTLFAAHLDHGIRPESADDADFCRALCAKLGVPFLTVRLDVPAEAARAGEGLETAARRLRHAWLRRVKDAVGADCIALAHHMDDQAETVLMHLARGAGPEGIGGMRGALRRPVPAAAGLSQGGTDRVFAEPRLHLAGGRHQRRGRHAAQRPAAAWDPRIGEILSPVRGGRGPLRRSRAHRERLPGRADRRLPGPEPRRPSAAAWLPVDRPAPPRDPAPRHIRACPAAR